MKPLTLNVTRILRPYVTFFVLQDELCEAFQVLDITH
jgi:hypothetical protein